MREKIAAQLDAYLATKREDKFRYGTFDCVGLALGWMKTSGLTTPFDTLRWSSLPDGMKALSDLGFADWIAATDSFLEKREVLTARRGDLVAHGKTKALGICCGARCVFPNPEKGLSFVTLSDCSHAWTVL